MEGSIEGFAAVLCNDKPETFGAPDVLRLSVEQVNAKYVMDQYFYDRPPSQVNGLGATFESLNWSVNCI